MKKIIKFALLVVAFMVVVACGAKNKTVNITKDGTVYEYANVSFTYPNSFKKQDATLYNDAEALSDHIKTIFTKDQEEITLMIDPVIENNKVEELIQLFRVEVETTGATIISNAKVTLTNGDSCYEIVAENGDVKAKYMVIFEGGDRYCLKYKTTTKKYDDKIINMDKFLYTFAVKEQGE
ncbi:hypothetical protein [Beduini massiliensis]|uniref:hypothetical protein n=1 Tax=Beduini massiliensis TaxID=1585974 RepID=UPI00059A833E|nr:hypothetical protein [Beduini massiliensis]